MENYQPPFTISNTILQLIANISEKVGAIHVENVSVPLHLRRDNRIQSIYSSLRIEANSLTLNQVRDVINGRLVLGEKKEIQEVKNAYDAYEQLPKINPYSIDDLLRVHGIMTKYLINESGQFRHGEEGVFSNGKCIFMAPPARMVPSLMHDLFAWLKCEQKTIHPLILSAVFHYEFVFIHPFADGNGRMARLWHTALLAQWQKFFLYFPLESQIEKFQTGYYDAIAQCHKDGASTAFIEFMLQQIDSLLAEMMHQLPAEQASISLYVQKLLSVMQDNTSYSARELRTLLKQKTQAGLQRTYLKPALEAGIIRMTIPDKPRSRNQRYVKNPRNS